MQTPHPQFWSQSHERCAMFWIEWKINFPIFISLFFNVTEFYFSITSFLIKNTIDWSNTVCRGIVEHSFIEKKILVICFDIFSIENIYPDMCSLMTNYPSWRSVCNRCFFLWFSNKLHINNDDGCPYLSCT